MLESTDLDRESSAMNSISLKAAGLKITGPRMRMLELLSTQSDKHHSAEDIYAQM